jgi:hypothetical protein
MKQRGDLGAAAEEVLTQHQYGQRGVRQHALRSLPNSSSGRFGRARPSRSGRSRILAAWTISS